MTTSMSRILSREALREDIMVALGHPVIRVNLTVQQLDRAIDGALKVFWKYHRNGSYDNYVVYRPSQQDVERGWIKLPHYIDAVKQVLPRGEVYNNMSFATADWQMQRETFMSMNRFSAVSALDYSMVMQRVSNLSHVLGHNHLRFEFVRYQRKLILLFNFREDELLTFLVSENLDPTRTDPDAPDCSEVWDDEQMKSLAVAQAKQIWGQSLSKFTGIQLPGGAQLNGDTIFQSGKQDEQDIIEKMSLEMPVGFLMG